MYPPVYKNAKVVDGLLVYTARVKGELVRVRRDSAKQGLTDEMVRRRDYYQRLLAAIELVGTSLDASHDWPNVKAKVTLLQDYRTTRGDLRHHILLALKGQAAPISVNELHALVTTALKLKFATKAEQDKHRAIVVEALHDLRRGPPALVTCTHTAKFGGSDGRTQRWSLKRLR